MKYALLFIVGALAAGWSHETHLIDPFIEEFEVKTSEHLQSLSGETKPL
jgi:hypothetical protein